MTRANVPVWAVICVSALVAIAASGCRSVRRAETVPCTPGAAVVVSCGCSGVGRECSGDPTLTLCDGVVPPSACARGGPNEIAFDDDGECGLCPSVGTTCPASGRLTVVPAAFSSGNSFSCPWDIRETSLGGTGLPDAG